MAFEIVLTGVPHSTVRKHIVDVVGRERVMVEAGHLVVSAPDQSAVVGLINTINGLGCGISEVRRPVS